MKRLYIIIILALANILSISAQTTQQKEDYMFILNRTPTLRMQHPNRDDIPRDGKIFHALSYDSHGYAFIYNEYVCGYYDVPYELKDGFRAGARNLQATNPSLYWKKVKRIMDDIDAYWKKQEAGDKPKKTANLTQSNVPIKTPFDVVSQKTTEYTDKEPYGVVEQMPSYTGGMGALMQYLCNNVKYPVEAENQGIQGRVICTFVVEKDGSITNVKVSKSVDPSLDAEAVRVLSAMPRWIPGKQDGKPVQVNYTLPVTFRLQ